MVESGDEMAIIQRNNYGKGREHMSEKEAHWKTKRNDIMEGEY